MLSPSLMCGWTSVLNLLLRISAPPATFEDGVLVECKGVILELNVGTPSLDAAVGGCSDPCVDFLCSSCDLGPLISSLEDSQTTLPNSLVARAPHRHRSREPLIEGHLLFPVGQGSL
jgi:hypothetical protein